MRKHQDLTQIIILIILAVLALIISNVIIKGSLLLLFSGILVFNILSALKTHKEDRYIARVWFGLLLFLVSVLALASIYMIVTSFVEVL